MDKKDIVTDFDLSLNLKELGVPQTSLFYWSFPIKGSGKNAQENKMLETVEVELYSGNDNWGKYFGNVRAFTVQELGNFFPPNIQLPFKRPTMYKDKSNGENVWSEAWFWNEDIGRKCAATEVEARARMLIYLLIEKKITL